MDDHKPGFTIMIIPHTGEKPLTIRVSAFLVKSMVVIIGLCGLLGVLFINSYRNYQAEAADYQYLLDENRQLQEKILFFADTTQKLQARLEEIQSLDSTIRDMLDLQSSQSTEIVLNLREQLAEPVLRPVLAARGGLGGTIEATSRQLNQMEKILPLQEQSLSSLEVAVVDYKNRLAATPSIWPTRGHITSPYGYRRSPFGYGNDFHSGIDIGAPLGTPIYATARGVVKSIRYTSGYGRHILIDHGYGFTTLYAHLYRYTVRVGQKVERGDMIGYVGNSGRSTGPHLHYEVRINGSPRNPVPYLTPPDDK